MIAAWRRVLGTVAVGLAGALVPVCLVTWWVVGTVADTDRFIDRVTPVLSTPEVRDLVVKGATSLVADPVLVQLVEPVTRTAVASPAFTPTVRG
ncbi:MAG: hypothetical protein ACRCYX_10120, partial [Dermatophilaceae bacterium]